MEDIRKIKDDIVKVLFFINIILFGISFFVQSRAFLVTTLIINIVFLGSFIVITKYWYVLNSGNKMLGTLNKSLDYFTNMGRQNG